MSKKGTCSNCGREKTLPYKDICGGCYTRIKGMDWDSPECKAALAKAKQDFNNPAYKQTHKQKPAKKINMDKLKEGMSRLRKKAKRRMSYADVIQPRKIGDVLSDIKYSGYEPDDAVVLRAIDSQIEKCEERVKKLNKMREILAA